MHRKGLVRIISIKNVLSYVRARFSIFMESSFFGVGSGGVGTKVLTLRPVPGSTPVEDHTKCNMNFRFMPKENNIEEFLIMTLFYKKRKKGKREKVLLCSLERRLIEVPS